MTDERYVVKLASGNYLVTSRGGTAARQRDAGTFTRDEAYRSGLTHGGVALRLRPSARAAELAKLRGEVARLEAYIDGGGIDRRLGDTVAKLRAEVEGLRKARDDWKARHEQAQGYIDGPGKDIVDKLRAEMESHEMAVRLLQQQLDAMTAERDALAAKFAALPPARPVEELRDELHGVFHGTNAPTHESWGAVAKRARELGAR